MSHASTITPVVRFRRLPPLTRGDHDYVKFDYPAEREEHCSQRTGHVLIIQNSHLGGTAIFCIDCGATWKYEGF